MVTAIIAAAGQGKRMGLKRNKIFVPLFHEPIIVQSVKALANSQLIDQLIIVADPQEVLEVKTLLSQCGLTKPCHIVAGGNERQYSIANALAVAPDSGLLLIHDGARPLIDSQTINKVIAVAELSQAAVVGVPVKDTVKCVKDGIIVDTPDRRLLWSVQTPQVFEARLIKRAYKQAAKQGFLGTDDASLVEKMGVKVVMVEGRYENIKITTSGDIKVARALFAPQNVPPRIGFGYDVHAFAENRLLILGGVTIPYQLGLAGHSDADVMLHAITDALLGAAGLGDIGRHFPDSDPAYKGISSLLLLGKVFHLLQDRCYLVNNIDVTIVAQQPKLAPFVGQMNQNIAQTLDIELNQVNVKATTTEGLGFAGRKEGIAAYAIVSVLKGSGNSGPLQI
jgi:2-C-methyl-D-erythritol 4-phosphate cytidylyltransferase/2-C-methyl-D-erythritol 2,4-cyclodiphosphate synthase